MLILTNFNVHTLLSMYVWFLLILLMFLVAGQYLFNFVDYSRMYTIYQANCSSWMMF
jgi:hypothetical protein